MSDRPTPDCWCSKCRPVTMMDMRMVVCPSCGDKRCVHAADHSAPCAKDDIHAHNAYVQRQRADALEELARVKKAISESCDEQRGEYFGCRRAERAEAALAESERKCERGCFCLMEMMQAYERRVRSLCAPEEIEKRPWECAEYNKAAEYLRAVWKPDAYHDEFKEES